MISDYNDFAHRLETTLIRHGYNIDLIIDIFMKLCLQSRDSLLQYYRHPHSTWLSFIDPLSLNTSQIGKKYTTIGILSRMMVFYDTYPQPHQQWLLRGMEVLKISLYTPIWSEIVAICLLIDFSFNVTATTLLLLSRYNITPIAMMGGGPIMVKHTFITSLKCLQVGA